MEKQQNRAAESSQASTASTTKPFGDDTIYSGTQAAERLISNFPPPEQKPCEFCGKMRRAYGMRIGNKVMWMSQLEICDCEQAQEAEKRRLEEQAEKERRERQAEEDRRLRERIQKLIGNSGMGARFLVRTFDTFEVTDENRKPALACQRYAERFRQLLPSSGKLTSRNGLFITGPKGTGKTHLAAAIANKLLHEGIAVICMTMIDLLDKIKGTYDRYADGESGVLAAYREVPLLIIDDMGKEQATEWAVSKIYTIINARYEAMLPTVITTNYNDTELLRRLTPRETGDPTTADAAIDRLREMCTAITTTGDSWRWK